MTNDSRTTLGHGARGDHRSGRALLLAAAIVATLPTSGCATTETRVRVVSRAGALRDGAVLPTPPATLRIAAGRDALGDDELAVVEAALSARLRSSLAALQARPASAAPVVRAGRIEVVRARAGVTVGRDVHRHQATCRLRVLVDDTVVADAEGEAVRAVPVRNVSAVELAAVAAAVRARGGRNPLIARDDVAAALGEACDAALRAVTFDVRPEDAVVADPRDGHAPSSTSLSLRAAARGERRARALAALESGAMDDKARAAALIELVDVGVVFDAPQAAAALQAPSALIRRAADAAFVALCAGQPTFAPEAEAACTRPPPPASAGPSAPAVPPRVEPPVRPVRDDGDDEHGDEGVSKEANTDGDDSNNTDPASPSTALPSASRPVTTSASDDGTQR
ncbi:MAG: hypothetical protein FJ137_14290 [Deltaproteobacteria bacterium]|nr:hypothetical protein [Deltaproteobacteria bacterium]